MAEQPQNSPQNYGLNTPPEFPPVQPTEAFKMGNYTPPPHQVIPTQEMPNTAAPAARLYTPTPTPFASSYPMPARKKRVGAGVWVLGGCGMAAVIGIVLVASLSKNVMDQLGKSDVMKNAGAMPTARRDLAEIRTGLDKYLQAHQGKYPANLSDAVDSSYLTYMSNTGSVKVQYAVPAANAPDDTAIARFYIGQLSFSLGRTVNQRNYICLLKSGILVQEQVTQTPLQGY